MAVRPGSCQANPDEGDPDRLRFGLADAGDGILVRSEFLANPATDEGGVSFCAGDRVVKGEQRGTDGGGARRNI
jgi:hypothetical protein